MGTVCTMYVELDHSLVPGNIQDINGEIQVPEKMSWKHRGTPRYKVVKNDFMEILADNEHEKRINKEQDKAKKKEFMDRFSAYENGSSINQGQPEAKRMKRIQEMFGISNEDFGEESAEEKDFEAVIGTKDEVYFDHDFGFFSAVLACYNNHWVLKTSPDDWWNVIVRNVAQAVDDNGDKDNVRKFFVEHQGKKTIGIEVPSLAHLDYSWLFDQFAQGIRMNIKTPGYVDVMQADFTTTTKDQLISTQIMLMASVQKYFDFCCYTACGIPGVELVGEVKDWKRLLEKTSKLKKMLQPVMKEIGLGVLQHPDYSG